MGLVGRIAGHGATALHALLVLRHRGHTCRKLQTQQASNRHYDEQSFPHTLIDATCVGRAASTKGYRKSALQISRKGHNSGVQLEISGERFGAESPILVHSWCTIVCK
jgi:hypothetical protein